MLTVHSERFYDLNSVSSKILNHGSQLVTNDPGTGVRLLSSRRDEHEYRQFDCRPLQHSSEIGYGRAAVTELRQIDAERDLNGGPPVKPLPKPQNDQTF
jgi:hypothetical protein